MPFAVVNSPRNQHQVQREQGEHIQRRDGIEQQSYRHHRRQARRADLALRDRDRSQHDACKRGYAHAERGQQPPQSQALVGKYCPGGGTGPAKH